ncbi:protein-glutamate O-methyltransferase CheR [Aestuariibius sp. HNIBRBA575]|uniref:CheR family methyltransferase n=1 Tax=Aestuariibius sp. HNIBRBA575 TaxID=3233343 RepID=UPI0034A5AAED
MKLSEQISNSDFNGIAQLMRDLTGIHLTESKKAMVSARLSRRIKHLKMSGFPEYCSYVATASANAEREELILALTTNITKFNRESKQFDHLQKHKLPLLIDKARNGGRVRIWSAGCSTGEEPYSLAFRIMDMFPDVLSYDFKVLATDIDRNVVKKARAGQYTDTELASVSEPHLRKYIRKGHGAKSKAQIEKSVMDMITFNVLNLLGEWPFSGSFDVIMCRNVAIYFENETQNELWGKFANKLQSDGVLYIGHSEGISSPMDLGLKTIAPSTFQKTQTTFDSVGKQLIAVNSKEVQ